MCALARGSRVPSGRGFVECIQDDPRSFDQQCGATMLDDGEAEHAHPEHGNPRTRTRYEIDFASVIPKAESSGSIESATASTGHRARQEAPRLLASRRPVRGNDTVALPRAPPRDRRRRDFAVLLDACVPLAF